MSNTKKKKISLTNQILLASVLAVIIGSFVGEAMGNIEFIGTIWLRLIQMNIILLIMTAVINAIGSIGGATAGKLSFHTFKYIITMTFFSAFLGLGLALLIKPGLGVELGGAVAAGTNGLGATSLVDTLINFVPKNIFKSMSEGGTVQVILFSLVFGIGASQYVKEEKRDAILSLVEDLNGVVMKMIKMVMKFAPIGIFALLGSVAGTTGLSVVVPMIKFLLALLIADIVMFLVYFPIGAYKIGINPLKMPKKFAKMSIMALTITSSAVCLPTKIEDSVEKFGVSRRIADFTGPITMTMNSSGAVACYVLAIMFMAQSTGTVLTTPEILMGVFLAAMMTMGTIVVPGGSIVVYTFFASALNLPMESIAILIAVDWFAGALRTVMNVDLDVLIGMLVSYDLGEFNYDVYNNKVEVEYEQSEQSA